MLPTILRWELATQSRRWRRLTYINKTRRLRRHGVFSRKLQFIGYAIFKRQGHSGLGSLRQGLVLKGVFDPKRLSFKQKVFLPFHLHKYLMNIMLLNGC